MDYNKINGKQLIWDDLWQISKLVWFIDTNRIWNSTQYQPVISSFPRAAAISVLLPFTPQSDPKMLWNQRKSDVLYMCVSKFYEFNERQKREINKNIEKHTYCDSGMKRFWFNSTVHMAYYVAHTQTNLCKYSGQVFKLKCLSKKNFIGTWVVECLWLWTDMQTPSLFPETVNIESVIYWY